jgi:hypothetical protein
MISFSSLNWDVWEVSKTNLKLTARHGREWQRGREEPFCHFNSVCWFVSGDFWGLFNETRRRQLQIFSGILNVFLVRFAMADRRCGCKFWGWRGREVMKVRWLAMEFGMKFMDIWWYWERLRQYFSDSSWKQEIYCVETSINQNRSFQSMNEFQLISRELTNITLLTG